MFEWNRDQEEPKTENEGGGLVKKEARSRKANLRCGSCSVGLVLSRKWHNYREGVGERAGTGNSPRRRKTLHDGAADVGERVCRPGDEMEPRGFSELQG